MANEQVEQFNKTEVVDGLRVLKGHVGAAMRDLIDAAIGLISNPGPAEPSAAMGIVQVEAGILMRALGTLGVTEGNAHNWTPAVESLYRIASAMNAPAASSADDGVKCKTCSDTKRVKNWFNVSQCSDGMEPCPDCAPNTREEK